MLVFLRAVVRRKAAPLAALALVFVIAGTTMAASRYASWRLGVVESLATYTTGIAGSMAGSVLSITNTNASTLATAARAISAVTRARRSVGLFAQNTAGGAAAQFLVGTSAATISAAAPFVTNARGLVRNLNADYLDGLTSTHFLRSTAKAVDADKLDGADSSAYQLRVANTCAVGSSIRAINADGTVLCEADDNAGTTYTGAAPITVSGTTIGLAGTGTRCADGYAYKFSEEGGWACAPDAVDGGNAATLDGVDSTQLQRRVSGTCAVRDIITAINADGTVSCGADAGGTVAAAEQNALVTVASQTWTDIPGATVTFSLPRSTTVNMRAHGAVWGEGGATASDSTYCGFRFVVDGAGQGDLLWGDRAVGVPKNRASVTSGQQWLIERDVSLAAGSHAVRLQMKQWHESTNLACRIEERAEWRAKLWIEAR